MGVMGYFSGVVLGGLVSLGSLFGGGDVDPYYKMEAANLNTMNSYFIPAQAVIQPSLYPDINQKDFFGKGQDLHIMSSYVGVLLQILLLLVTRFFISKKGSSGRITFGYLYEMVYSFFEEIIGKREKPRIKSYVVGLFFILLYCNLVGVLLDVLRFPFPWLLRNITTPTAELEFNVAMAIIAVGLTLLIQIKNLGFWRFLHEYFPITGKGLIEGNGFFARLGDIVISMFIGLLDIIGTFAKVISLSMRMFGNMSSGSILLNVTFLGIGAITTSLLGVNITLGLPIIIYIQGLLVAGVQALVFSLLVAIFIKLAGEGDTINGDEEVY